MLYITAKLTVECGFRQSPARGNVKSNPDHSWRILVFKISLLCDVLMFETPPASCKKD